tara:strand:+ start:10925 stop:11116 length:192 start_codon:yes stop_codon:yes gene_type:complete
MNKKLKKYKVVFRRGYVGQESWLVGEDELREFVTLANSSAEAVIRLVNLDFAFEVESVERVEE